jgi:N-acetylmuramoyl-L-alanine amidase
MLMVTKRARSVWAGISIVGVLAMMMALVPAAAAADSDYVVAPGDTLSEIAEQYGFTVEQLVWMNGIDNPDLIFPGERLVLEASGNAVAADEVIYEEPVEETYADVPQGGGELPPYFESWDIEWLLEFYANEYGWDPNLTKAQAWQESNWRQDEISWTGAIGVMQIMPGTAAEMNDWYFGRNRDVWSSAEDNIEMGVAYLSVLYEETGSVRLALASYYQGWGSVQRDGLFPDTKQYVRRIMRFQEMFANGQLP